VQCDGNLKSEGELRWLQIKAIHVVVLARNIQKQAAKATKIKGATKAQAPAVARASNMQKRVAKVTRTANQS